MQGLTAAGASGDWLRPTRGRLLLAAGLAAAAWLLPQEAPLAWYPLNEPGDDVLRLEISCAANAPGTVQILYDLTRGFNDLDAIRWPVSATAKTFTYTFPLPDAPLVALQLNPPAGGTELTIAQLRITNRRGEEIRRFTCDQFRAGNDIAAISPTADGWKVVSTADGRRPAAFVVLAPPVIPAGQDRRNLQRCLLSTGYLALLLWILLLAVLFVFRRPAGRRDWLGQLGFLAGLALLFALVGNRGLIRDSVHYARYQASAAEVARSGP